MKTAAAAWILALLTAVACSRDDRREAPATGREHPAAAERMDARSQRDLAQDIAGAEKLGKDQAAERYGEIRHSWLGKRVTWKLDLVQALCLSAASCHALPFDRLGADRAIVQGWMPRLRLDAAAFAALQSRCAGRARCPVTVEATVAALALSVDEPTSLTLGDIRVVTPAGS